MVNAPRAWLNRKRGKNYIGYLQGSTIWNLWIALLTWTKSSMPNIKNGKAAAGLVETALCVHFWTKLTDKTD
jgi:hypothetical protein